MALGEQQAFEPLCLQSNVLDIDDIKHGFFGRCGGVSLGDYESLNVSLSMGDNENSVLKNRNLVTKFLGFNSIFMVNQVHRNDVLVVEKNTVATNSDAMVTKEKGILLGIQTADCVPILLADPINKIIGAIHAGWRSAVSGVIANTILKMKELGADIINAAIGPCIHQESYEVDTAVKELVCDDIYFSPSSRVGHFMFDLPGYVYDQLKALNIKNIDIIDINTYLSNGFFSHRRSIHEGKRRGNQVSVIGVKD